MPPYWPFSANARNLSSLTGTSSRERTAGSTRRSGFIFSGKVVRLFRPFRARSDPEVPLAAAIYITGVAGFIGSHVAEALLVRGDRVFGLDNLDPFYDRSPTETKLPRLGHAPPRASCSRPPRQCTAGTPRSRSPRTTPSTTR